MLNEQEFNYLTLREKGVKVKIGICGGHYQIRYKGWNIKPFETTEQEIEKEGQQTKQEKSKQKFVILVKTLEESGIDIGILQLAIELFDINMYDSGEHLNMEHIDTALKQLEHLDVAHILNRSMVTESKVPNISSMYYLQKLCVLVCPCVSTDRPPAPVDYPCHMAIAVGIEDEKYLENIQNSPQKPRVNYQSCGSALDFVCPRQTDVIEIKDPWEASYYVTAIAALVLLKAYALGK